MPNGRKVTGGKTEEEEEEHVGRRMLAMGTPRRRREILKRRYVHGSVEGGLEVVRTY